jgi:nucleoside-diphosphate-sugar epimerase
LAETIKNNRTPEKSFGIAVNRMVHQKMDISKMHAMGWKHHVQLEEGIQKTYNWFRQY